MSADRFVWRPEDVQVRPIDLRDCSNTIPCRAHGEAYLPLWAELEDARVDGILEECHFDVGLDDNDGFYWSDPDR
jgi:hypothetical protein